MKIQDILDRHSTLKQAGYHKILALRDVYPDVKYDEISILRTNLRIGLPSEDPQITFILGVMEIEAWLLAEYKHFPNFH